jgi:hypothetical protein
MNEAVVGVLPWLIPVEALHELNGVSCDQRRRRPRVIGGRRSSLEIRRSGMRESFSGLRVTLVRQPIQQRRRHAFALEDLHPVAKR